MPAHHPTKEQLEKINEAISFCEKFYSMFVQELDNFYGEEKARNMSSFLLKNTYFAGGVFRSLFTDTKVNDIDIFFRNEEAVTEFKDIFLKDDSIFQDNQITSNGNFVFNFGSNQPYLNFITRKVAEPLDLLKDFDFTFNKHFYSIRDGDCYFDVDTFNKMGTVCNYEESVFNTFFRSLRFMQEGFKIPKNNYLSMLELIITNYNELDLEQATREITYHNSTGEGLKNQIHELLRDDISIGMTYSCITTDSFYPNNNDNENDGRKRGHRPFMEVTPEVRAVARPEPSPTPGITAEETNVHDEVVINNGRIWLGADNGTTDGN